MDHHADVLGHTYEVLDETVALERDPGGVLGDEHAEALAALLAEPLADELSRGTALRFGALLHDAAKPQTRATTPDGETLGFPGHDVQGADLSRAADRPEAAGAGELERLREELRVDTSARRWVEVIAPRLDRGPLIATGSQGT